MTSYESLILCSTVSTYCGKWNVALKEKMFPFTYFQKSDTPIVSVVAHKEERVESLIEIINRINCLNITKQSSR